MRPNSRCFGVPRTSIITIFGGILKIPFFSFLWRFWPPLPSFPFDSFNVSCCPGLSSIFSKRCRLGPNTTQTAVSTWTSTSGSVAFGSSTSNLFSNWRISSSGRWSSWREKMFQNHWFCTWQQSITCTCLKWKRSAVVALLMRGKSLPLFELLFEVEEGSTLLHWELQQLSWEKFLLKYCSLEYCYHFCKQGRWCNPP